jgi:hypothetical protein
MHALHAPPPVPHAVVCIPGWHDPFAQHPLHDVASQVQIPCTQCCPAAQDPCWHVPPQPSGAPHALPPQRGVHVPPVSPIDAASEPPPELLLEPPLEPELEPELEPPFEPELEPPFEPELEPPLPRPIRSRPRQLHRQ